MTKETDQSRFMLTYLVFKDDKKTIGHACVGLSEIKPNGDQELIFRVGLFPQNQVMMEDFIKHKDEVNRKFYQKSYSLTDEQVTQFLKRVNDDRHIQDLDTDVKQRVEKPVSKTKSPFLVSKPSGPKYDKYTFNCKDYALSLVESAGIKDKSLGNLGVSLPIFSGKLEQVILTQGKNGIIKLTKPSEKESYIRALMKKYGLLFKRSPKKGT